MKVHHHLSLHIGQPLVDLSVELEPDYTCRRFHRERKVGPAVRASETENK